MPVPNILHNQAESLREGLQRQDPCAVKVPEGHSFTGDSFFIYKTISRRNKLSAEEGDRLAQLVPSKRKGKKLVLKDI